MTKIELASKLLESESLDDILMFVELADKMEIEDLASLFIIYHPGNAKGYDCWTRVLKFNSHLTTYFNISCGKIFIHLYYVYLTVRVSDKQAWSWGYAPYFK